MKLKQVILSPKGYLYWLPAKKPPDVLIEDWLKERGEFSLSAQMSFEKRLRQNTEYKKLGLKDWFWRAA